MGINTFLYGVSALKSKYIREYYLDRYGLEKTVIKYDHVAGKRILLPDEVHEIIYAKILANEPLFVGRLGSIELLVAAKERLKIRAGIQNDIEILCNNAGFFPRDVSLLAEFSDVMIDAMSSVDVLGTWYLTLEDYAVNRWVSQDAFITEGRFLEPWYAAKPWTKALEGKKVLVIHPFTETIKEQYSLREKLFPSEEYLPSFELLTLKAVQTIAGNKDDRFANWFEALGYMFDESMKKKFDIALIGCGAYGFPLAARIKQAGRQAIHMGGVLQSMFGIRGKRWEKDKDSIVRDFYNEYWTRPSESEKPFNSENVENNCYW